MTTRPPTPARVIAAQAAADEATRKTRLAALAARDALGRRAERRRRLLRYATIALAVTVCALIVAGVVLGVISRAKDASAQRNSAVLGAASHAIETMLTANPAQAGQYADTVIELSTGTQRDRLSGARADLINEIAAQPESSTGVVVSAGLVSDPSSADDATSDVLIVAEATNPTLIGGDPAQKRMPIVVTMRLVDGQWKVERAGLQ